MARETWLRSRVRRLYFSEKLAVPNDPTSAVEFYLTVDGRKPKMFDMSSDIPNIVAEQGTVEDWIIENRSSELHAFHIHQLHFLLLDYVGDRSMRIFSAIPSTCRTTTAERSPIPAFACAWISAIRIRWELSSTIAIFWSMKTRE